MTIKVLHQRSAVKGKAPLPAGLEVGAIAVNYNHQSPALIIKGDDNVLVEFKPANPNALLGETGWACSDQTSDLTAGLKVTDRWVGSKTLLGVRLHCTVAPTGSPIIVSIKYGTAALFTTRPQIDVGQLTSLGSTVTPVLATTSIADGTDIYITIDQVGSTAKGKGLIVYLLWRRN